MKEELKEKIDYSIGLLRKAEKIALHYSQDGFYLAFSGGKDSEVLYELAKLAGVKFKAHMQLTSVDPPEVIRFVRTHYPEVVLHRPEKSIYRLIREKGMLPTRRVRYCCQVLKEQAGKGTVTLLGIRAAESPRRAKRPEFAAGYNPLEMDQFNIDREKFISCVGGRDKIMLSPILQ